MARTRVLDVGRIASWDVPVDPATVPRAREAATEQLASWGLDTLAFTTELVVSELVTNAIRHAWPQTAAEVAVNVATSSVCLLLALECTSRRTLGAMETRTLGRSGIEVSALGFGCWAIGGEWWDSGGKPLGWGKVDDDVSIRAVRQAFDGGVTFFDTADVYGTGHSETVLAKALAGHRDDVVIASKWGNTFDAGRRTLLGTDATAAYAREALTASLRRLGTDRIDLYQLHIGDVPVDAAVQLRETCEEFVREGLIRAYAWSTDDVERARVFAEGPRCAAVQHRLNVLEDAPETLALCDSENLASINRSPLAMGLLSGAYDTDSRVGGGDIRSEPPAWLAYFDAEGRVAPGWLERIAAIRDVLTSDGRTLAQGALAWIWARSPRTVPIPGCRTAAQAEANAGALGYGPLRPEQLAEIDKLLSR